MEEDVYCSDAAKGETMERRGFTEKVRVSRNGDQYPYSSHAQQHDATLDPLEIMIRDEQYEIEDAVLQIYVLLNGNQELTLMWYRRLPDPRLTLELLLLRQANLLATMNRVLH